MHLMARAIISPGKLPWNDPTYVYYPTVNNKGEKAYHIAPSIYLLTCSTIFFLYSLATGNR